jgi:hypothetical protein
MANITCGVWHYTRQIQSFVYTFAKKNRNASATPPIGQLWMNQEPIASVFYKTQNAAQDDTAQHNTAQPNTTQRKQYITQMQTQPNLTQYNTTQAR